MRKFTNMAWRSMGEATLLGLLVFGAVMYILTVQGKLAVFATWQEGVLTCLLLFAVVLILSMLYGLWSGFRLQRRLGDLQEAMLYMEKGHLSRPIPHLGEDEVGQLADQLTRISKKWEEQVNSLQRLSNSNAELAEKARYSAIIEERQRLARELHDAVSQQLFAISMTATAVKRTLDKDFDKAKSQISLIEEMASVAQSEMRALLLHLRPVNLEGKNLSSALSDLLVELRAKVPMELHEEIEEGIALSKGIEDHLFRITQEALSNALRHSKAGRLEVKLARRPDGVRLSVADDGVGFDRHTKKQASYGLDTMQERVNELGGSLQVITAPGNGTRIDIRIPLMGEEGEDTHVRQAH